MHPLTGLIPAWLSRVCSSRAPLSPHMIIEPRNSDTILVKLVPVWFSQGNLSPFLYIGMTSELHESYGTISDSQTLPSALVSLDRNFSPLSVNTSEVTPSGPIGLPRSR
uniref:Uncharacterized protein n=1 Tax=Trichobilharzia regenti TaxID=157069 RepID=A0AA85IXY9_TRIRE|nr:unnamed protein product [Trichobilharzia regenti]